MRVVFGLTAHKKALPVFFPLVDIEKVLANNGNMAISLYVQPKKQEGSEVLSFEKAFENWAEAGNRIKSSMSELFQILEN